MRNKSYEYDKLKSSWMEIVNNGQITDEIKMVTNMIRKDVLRTDRMHKFYSGEANENITTLYNILTTYALTHPSVGYCQVKLKIVNSKFESIAFTLFFPSFSREIEVALRFYSFDTFCFPEFFRKKIVKSKGCYVFEVFDTFIFPNFFQKKIRQIELMFFVVFPNFEF